MALPDAQFASIGGLRPTVAPTVCQADAGGINVVPGTARVQCCRRVAPGENLDEVQAGLTELAQTSIDGLDLGLGLAVSVYSRDAAFWEDPDCALVREVAAMAGTSAVVAPYGTNATGYARNAMATPTDM
jgi:acetylornithine deacetylase/succinyl-diaminopimelate desuccinylase-like protein